MFPLHNSYVTQTLRRDVSLIFADCFWFYPFRHFRPRLEEASASKGPTCTTHVALTTYYVHWRTYAEGQKSPPRNNQINAATCSDGGVRILRAHMSTYVTFEIMQFYDMRRPDDVRGTYDKKSTSVVKLQHRRENTAEVRSK